MDDAGLLDPNLRLPVWPQVWLKVGNLMGLEASMHTIPLPKYIVD